MPGISLSVLHKITHLHYNSMLVEFPNYETWKLKPRVFNLSESTATYLDTYPWFWICPIFVLVPPTIINSIKLK